MNLEDIISRRQDELRGRHRNWRDDLSDWWRSFSFNDLLWNVYSIAVAVYVLSIAALIFSLALK